MYSLYYSNLFLLKSLSSAEIRPPNEGLETGQFGFSGRGGGAAAAAALGNGQFQNWGDSGVVAPQSHHTDTSGDSGDKNQVFLNYSIFKR